MFGTIQSLVNWLKDIVDDDLHIINFRTDHLVCMSRTEFWELVKNRFPYESGKSFWIALTKVLLPNGGEVAVVTYPDDRGVAVIVEWNEELQTWVFQVQHQLAVAQGKVVLNLPGGGLQKFLNDMTLGDLTDGNSDLVRAIMTEIIQETKNYIAGPQTRGKLLYHNLLLDSSYIQAAVTAMLVFNLVKDPARATQTSLELYRVVGDQADEYPDEKPRPVKYSLGKIEELVNKTYLPQTEPSNIVRPMDFYVILALRMAINYLKGKTPQDLTGEDGWMPLLADQ